jgi:hypothetical protein
LDTVSRVVAELERRGRLPRRDGSGRWRSSCPVHGGNPDSLSVTPTGDGGCRITCSAGCPLPAILDNLGLNLGDMFSNGWAEAPSGKEGVR